MRRPLAVFGASFILFSWAAAGWQAGVLQTLAAAFAAALCVMVLPWLARRGYKGQGGKALPAAVAYLPVVLASLLLACVWRLGYDALLVRPVEDLAGTTAMAEARVVAVRPISEGETATYTLRVTALDGEALGHGFKTTVGWLPDDYQVGDALRLPLKFSAYPRGMAGYYYGKGIYVYATRAGEIEFVENAPALLDRAIQLQYSLSASIRQKLPARLGGITAAMTVGDRRYVPAAAVTAYRMSSLSHLQVVSGLHLAILCGVVSALLGRLLKNRRLAAVGCILFVLVMMAVTGFTPSIVRSGCSFILVFGAGLCSRRADACTSLGLAALLLCMQNPYAACDMGLQLSFAATLGLIGGGHMVALLRKRWREKELITHRAGRALRAWRWLLAQALRTVCITAATLPVLVLNGAGVSLLFLPMNLIAVPLMPFIIGTGLVMAIPAGVPVLGLLTRTAALVNGALLAFLERLTTWCAGLEGVYISLAGVFGFVVVLLVYALAWCSWRSSRPAYLVFAALVLVPGVLLASHFMARGTVWVTVAGTSNPSLVVTQGGQAVVLYRGSRNANAVQRVLEEKNAECILLMDMRLGSQGTEYERFGAAETLRVTDTNTSLVVEPLEDVSLWLRAQGNGYVLCVDVAGYKIGIASGSVDISDYAALDILLAGSGTVTGEYGALLTASTVPDWAGTGSEIILAQDGTQLWLRPGKALRIQEVQYGAAE